MDGIGASLASILSVGGDSSAVIGGRVPKLLGRGPRECRRFFFCCLRRGDEVDVDGDDRVACRALEVDASAQGTCARGVD